MRGKAVLLNAPLKRMKICLVFYCLVIISGTCYSQPKDTLFFKDGSVVVGKIKKVKLGVVTFDPANTNDINVQLRVLRTIAAARTVFRIETITGQVYYGNLVAQPDTSVATIIHE